MKDLASNFVVTPAFLDARERKLKNDITSKGVFPCTFSKDGGSATEMFVNKTIQNGRFPSSKQRARSYTSSSERKGTYLPSGRLTSSRERTGATGNRISLQSVQSNAFPPISPALNASFLGNAYSKEYQEKLSPERRGSSTSSQSAKNEDVKFQEINQWFTNASHGDKELAMNILSMITKKIDSGCNGAETAISGERRNLLPSPPVILPKMHDSFGDSMTNHGALTYKTSKYVPNEFVIHPEWNNRNDQVNLSKLRQKDGSVLHFGYWRN